MCMSVRTGLQTLSREFRLNLGMHLFASTPNTRLLSSSQQKRGGLGPSSGCRLTLMKTFPCICPVLRRPALPRGSSCKDLKNHKLNKPIILSEILTSRRLLLELITASTRRSRAAPQPVGTLARLSCYGQLPF